MKKCFFLSFKVASRLVAIWVVAITIGFSFFTSNVSAFTHINQYYFSGKAGSVGLGDCPLIYGGYSGGADKEAFIAAVLAAHNTPLSSGCPGAKSIGADYIIQTMQGYGLKVRKPNAADIANWVALIRQPSVTIETDNSYSYRVDTALRYEKYPFTQDVGMFYNTSSSPSTVFKQDKNVVYAVRNACANPVTNQPGSTGIKATPTNYDLKPSVKRDKTSGEAGSPLTVSPTVFNSGNAASVNTQWQLSQFTIPSGNTVPAGDDSGSDPKTFFGNGATTIDSGTGASYGVGTTPFGPRGVTIPDLPVGTKVCYALSVQPYDQVTVNWRHGPPVCVVVAKLPSVQVIGGDLRVGAAFTGSSAPAASTIQTSVTIKGTKSYGSWDEYGIAASGKVTGMASGSAYSGGLNCTLNCATNTLSFANESTPIGYYSPTTSIPDVAASFPVPASKPAFSTLADAAFKRVETSSTEDITITGGTIFKGQWLVINAPTKTVTITGDITYQGTGLSSLGDIPQLVIIANQINIEGNVKNVDAWLIASGSTGTINTCSKWNNQQVKFYDKLSSDICSDPLVINGPVMAKTLYLRRTAGAGSGSAKSNNPAEVINLRPDAYLWGIARVSGSGRLTTVYETELPPRF
jgi:hypothetical protein